MNKLYRKYGILWEIENHDFKAFATPRCPICRLYIEKSKEVYSFGEWKYKCIDCDFKITLNDDISNVGNKVANIIESEYVQNYDVVNLDGELVKITNKTEKDEDYWIDSKISKNKSGGKQLMVLIGSRKDSDKVQLFADIDNQKLGFDQNNIHPKELLAKVVAEFKDSISEINLKNNQN